MRGWRGLGAALLSRHLWPRDATTNAVMVYYSGRQRGRRIEDMLGLWPWLLLLVLDGAIMLFTAKRFSDVWAYGLAEYIFLFVFGSVCGAVLTTFHVRRTMEKMPIDELLTTRLKPLDIVQGLSIRPIAVQSAGVLLYSVGHTIIALWAAAKHQSTIGYDALIYITLFCVFRFYSVRYTVEMGGAIAMRANLCLRPLMTAAMRMSFDIAIALLLLMIPAAAISLLVAFLLQCFVPFQLVFIVAFLLCFGMIVSEVVRNIATDAMDWCHHYPDEWWINNSASAERVEFEERTLFSRWKPVEGRRRMYVPRSLRNPRNAPEGK